jgi:hypothetical protein
MWTGGNGGNAANRTLEGPPQTIVQLTAYITVNCTLVVRPGSIVEFAAWPDLRSHSAPSYPALFT